MSSQKAISPVIASIILVLVVIALGSTFLAFSGRLAQQSQATVEETTAEAARLAATSFIIEAVKDQRVFVRNTGNRPIDVKGLDVRIDDTRVNYTQEEPIEPGKSGTLRVTTLWSVGPGERTLKLSGAAYSTTKQIRIKPADGRVLDLRFEEGSGSTANDVSGNDNDGVLNNGPQWVKGKFGGALNFDGVDDYVRTDSLAGYAGGTAPITIEAWAKTNTVATGTVMIAETGTDGTFDGLSIERRTAQWAARIGSGPAQTGGVAAVGAWSHIVGSWKDGTVSLYVNGVFVGSGDDGVSANLDKRFTVGASGLTSPAEFFDGNIDEVRIYNRAYAPDELYVMELA